VNCVNKLSTEDFKTYKMHANCDRYLVSRIQQKVTNEINSPFCRAAELQPSLGYPDRTAAPHRPLSAAFTSNQWHNSL